MIKALRYQVSKKYDSKSYRRWIRKYDKGQVMKRKRTFRARTTYRGVPSNKNLAAKIKRLEKGITGKEWKNHDLFDSEDGVDDSGVVIPLTYISQGNTSETREGLIIKLQSIQMKMQIENDAAQVNKTLARWMIFFDTENTGTLPTVSEVLENNSPLGMRDHQTAKTRFIILKDKTFILNPQFSGQIIGRFYKYYKKFKGRRCFYLGSAADAASQGKGGLYLLLISTLAANGPDVDYSFRIKYTD